MIELCASSVARALASIGASWACGCAAGCGPVAVLSPEGLQAEDNTAQRNADENEMERKVLLADIFLPHVSDVVRRNESHSIGKVAPVWARVPYCEGNWLDKRQGESETLKQLAGR